MVSKVRTLDFLPDIFRTPTNSQVLRATLDQLVQQPNLRRIQGYIGSKFGYDTDSDNKYVIEPTAVRQDYQLEPAVTFLKDNTNTPTDLLTYPGILDALKLEGSLTDNPQKLFSSDIYSWDGFINLDTFINYGQYYWLPQGPDPVTVSTDIVFNQVNYQVFSEPSQGYHLEGTGVNVNDTNPTITLLRGGTYTFQVNQSSEFWIQGVPGVTGLDPLVPTLNTRDVLGVYDNGTDVGIVTFNVPAKNAQDTFLYPGNQLVDLVSNLPFSQINNVRLSQLGGIDGVTSGLNGLTVLFNNGIAGETASFGYYEQSLWDQTSSITSNVSFDDNSAVVDVSAYFWEIKYMDSSADPVIQLVPKTLIATNTKITANFGTQYAGRNFVRDTFGLITLIPYLSAMLDTLYYQDGTNPNAVGVIKLIDNNTSNSINVDIDILGKKTYTSPNGVKFTNGLKVKFSGDVYPSEYLNTQYYVQGVGVAIELLPVGDFIVPEKFTGSLYNPYDVLPYDIDNYDDTLYVPRDQDYITIARNSIDKNAWSRSNRWFHIDVIKATAEYNKTNLTIINDQTIRAKRPIIEFYPNLRLFDSGIRGKRPVDFIDTTTTNAFTFVTGQLSVPIEGISTASVTNSTTIPVDIDVNIYAPYIKAGMTLSAVGVQNTVKVVSGNDTQIITAEPFTIPNPTTSITNAPATLETVTSNTTSSSTVPLNSVNGISAGQLVRGINIVGECIVQSVDAGTSSIEVYPNQSLSINDELSFITSTNTFYITDTTNVSVGQHVTGTNISGDPVVIDLDPVTGYIVLSTNERLADGDIVQFVSPITVSYSPDPDPTNVASPLYQLFDGARVIFANDADPNVRNKVYVVHFINVTGSFYPVATLTEALTVASDGLVSDLDQTVIVKGYSRGGYTYMYNNGQWEQAQTKTRINQPPLFDIFDENGISFGQKEFYDGTTFTGTELFSYGIGTGAVDPVLGIPLRYTSVVNIGDISFDVNYNSDTFQYIDTTGNISTKLVSDGYVHCCTSATTYKMLNGWVKSYGPSVQYQVFNFDYNPSVSTNVTFDCDIAAYTTNVYNWANIRVYINGEFIKPAEYTTTVTSNKTTITLNATPLENKRITIGILSDQVSKTGYFQVPMNLELNPFNTNITTTSVGDVRNQYKSIFNNADLTGQLYGTNNYRDAGPLIQYGDSIIQNSASLVLPSVFLRKQNHNLYNALSFNANEYEKYKSTLIDLAVQTEYTIYDNPATILDNVLLYIGSVKNENSSFFWSDMVPTGSPYAENTYLFRNASDTTIYPLSKVYDFSSANYNGVLVYVYRVVNSAPVYIQLTKDVDYTVSSDQPYVTVNYDLLSGDQVTVKEYNQTYGSYVPNTPSKLGLYQSYIPQIVYDDTYSTPTYMLKGHDGSLTKLYGEYTDGRLNDIRDIILLEFEQRIYNNIKVSQIAIDYTTIIPGYSRTTEYSYEELNKVHSIDFLNWVGKNRVDYKSQYYDKFDEFTYNYRGMRYATNEQVIQSGYWRGMYRWLFDTDKPHTNPWEMLGLSNMPSWWTSRYGLAPYTSDNTLLWDDIRDGIVWNNNNPYTVESRVRPDLYTFLPVDSYGNLREPMNFVGEFNENLFQRDWIPGDDSPTESAYMYSSTYAFDLVKLFALTKTADFYNFGVDIDLYKYNSYFDQYLYKNRYHLNPAVLEVYGNGTAKHSYINFIIDYEKQYGIDATTNISNLLKNLNVQLVYRMAGFSDNNLTKFFVDKASPNSKNNSLLIPEESHTFLMYDNQPYDRITFSSIIVQKTTDGYKVYGNSQNKAYFVTSKPIPNGKFELIEVGNDSVKVPITYSTTETIIVPYGTEFKSTTEVCYFIGNYMSYLEQQGVKFDNIESGVVVNKFAISREFLYWSQSGWTVGSTVSLNASAKVLTINQPNGIVQPLTIQQQNFILNQNLLPIQNRDLIVVREDNTFKASAMKQGDTLSYANLNISNFENVVVFDNKTVFNDVIYNLVTGLRQKRLILQGSKTAEWTGLIDGQGFIVSQDNIVEWNSGVTYTKGSIVKYKNNYWVANKIIQPAAEFNNQDWTKTDASKIQIGLLPNSSTRSYESTLYYDINRSNLNPDDDILGYSLIGYRPREYLASADLSDTTQINVYKNLLGGKGTLTNANVLRGATLTSGAIDYNIHENWAIKTNEYAGVLNQNFVEFILDESKLTGNPSIVGLTQSENINGVQQNVPIYKLTNYARPITSPNILPLVTDYQEQLSSAGFVNFNDVKFYAYNYLGLRNFTPYDVTRMYVGDYIWLADDLGFWNIYTPIALGTQLVTVLNNLNNTVTLVFDQPHNLSKDDKIAIVSFNVDVNGYYTINSVVDLYRVNVSLSLDPSLLTLIGNGVVFRMESLKVEQPSDIANITDVNEYQQFKVWVNQDVDNSWSVYEKSVNFKNEGTITSNTSSNLGSCVAYGTDLDYLVGDSDNGVVYRYGYDATLGYLVTQQLTQDPGFGSAVAFSGTTVAITETNSNPANSKVYIYKLVKNSLVDNLILIQTITRQGSSTEWGKSLAISGDERWLYIGAPDINRVYAYALDTTTTNTSVVNTYADIAIGDTSFLVTGDYTSDIIPGTEIVFGSNTNSYIVSSSNYDTVTYCTGTITTSASTDTMTTSGNTNKLVANQPIRFTSTIGGVSTGTTYYVKTILNSTSFTITDTLEGSVFALTNDSGSMDVVSTTYGKTIFGVSSAFTETITSGTTIYSVATLYSQATNYISSASSSSGDEFGHSIGTNYEGNIVVIGAPYQEDMVNVYNDAGAMYYFDRLVQNYQVTFNSLPGIPQLFLLVDALPLTPIVTVNGLTLIEGTDFTILNDRIYDYTLTIAGATYATATNVSLTGGSGTGAKADIISVNGGGAITNIVVSDLGTGYQVGDLLTVSGGDGAARVRVDSINSALSVTATLLAGDIVSVNTDLFVESQQIQSDNSHLGGNFGISVDTNRVGNEIISGAPFETTVDNYEGAVYRYTNPGKHFGSVVGVSSCSTLVSPITLLINGFRVDVNGTPADIVSAINLANINNVTASVSLENILTISLIDINLGIMKNNLNVIATNAGDLQLLGIDPLILTQTLRDPHKQTTTRYGYVVQFNETNSFAVSATTATRYEDTTFDFVDDSNSNNDTLLDNGATIFVDTFPNAGEVYVYDFLDAVDASISNPGAYIYAQSTNDLSSDYGSQPYYGSTLAFNNGVVMAGAPSSVTTTNGKVVVYVNTTQTNNWSVFRRSGEIVDITKLGDIQLFTADNNETLDFLDYIDPLQGKLLGAVRENLDFITSQDPACYNMLVKDSNTGSVTWGSAFVGKLWFDTNNVKFVNYHQTDVVYNGSYWGTVFPGSDVAVYTWIESLQTPSEYTGVGTVYSLTDYATEFTVDASGALIPKYYYWVRNTTITSVNLGKTLNDSICEQYIRDPRSSGIGFLAPIASSVFGIFNSFENIREQNTVIHIGFSTGNNDDMAHTEFTLIRDGVPDDFLPGLPTALNNFDSPQSLYRKMIDSLTGVDVFGNVVPDPTLPKLVQTGISVRPRQSFFADRYLALENYLTYVNKVIVQFPISESRIPGFLKASDTYYDTTQYWEYVNWWAPGYNNSTKAAIEVPKFYDLQTINATEGLIAKVTANSDGKRETYIYENSQWVRIGLEQGTIQFKSALWDYAQAGFGFGNAFFDSTPYDAYPDAETRYIIRAINEEILINDLLLERNKALILLFNFIESESRERQNYLPWLNKTSFIDVEHIVSQLKPYNRFQRDNQDLLAGYINEVKPYHVVIKDFEFKYSSNDTYEGDITDFDLPAQYNSETGRFESPQLIYTGSPGQNQYLPSSSIWTENQYVSWFNNYGITGGTLVDYPVCNLARYISNNTNVIYVNDIIAMPVTGTIRIDDEIISYGSVDRYNNALLNVTRGVDNTTPTDHLPDAQIYITVGPVSVVNTGRAYSNPPLVTAYIDTTIYPEPRVPAILAPIMAGDKVIGIKVTDPGDGFAVTPEIVIEPSITVTFDAADVSSSFDTIALMNNQFITGDLVKYRYGGSSTAIGGLVNNGHYYIGVVNQANEYTRYVQSSITGGYTIELDSVDGLFPNYYVTGQGIVGQPIIQSIDTVNKTITIDVAQTLTINEELVITSQQNKVIAFYTNYKNCINDVNRINLVVTGNEGEQYLDLGAVAHYISASAPIREINTVLKFDRTSYTPSLQTWTPGTFYAGVLVNPYEEASSTYPSSTYPDDPGAEQFLLASSQGILINIVDVDTSVTPISITVNYNYNLFVQTTITGATVIEVDNTFGMLPGLKVTGTNITGAPVITDVDYVANTITVDIAQTLTAGDQFTVEKLNRVYPGQIDGQQVTLYNGTPTLTPGINCYIKVTGENTLDLYNNPLLTNPLTTVDFDIATGDYLYLKEPWTFDQSLVVYDGKVFRCIVSNNDTVFNYDNWEELSSDSKYLNALDRIVAYYKPTVNMPGLDFTQLLQGVTYPNATYYSNAFPDDVNNPTNQYPLDTELLPQTFSIRGLTSTGIVYNNSKYYIVASNSNSTYVLTSTNGTLFTIGEIANSNLGPTGLINANGSYVISTLTQLSSVIKSADTINWFATGTPADYLNGIYYDSSVGLYLGYGNNIVYSTDSNQNWVQGFNFGSSFSNSINQIIKLEAPIFDGYIAVAGGSTSTYPTLGRILISNDGLGWTEYPYVITTDSLNTAVMDATVGVLVIAGDNGTMFSSVNANTWIPIVSPTSENLTTSIFANGYYVVAGENGTILYSQYGVTGTWSIATVDTGIDIKSLAFDGTRFVAVGTDDTIMFSTDDTPLTWTSSLYVIQQPDTDYIIKGDPYTAGYGPEEMVPGVVTDTLQMIVTTRPGSSWTYDTYDSSGYTVLNFTSLVDENSKLDFSNVTVSPAGIDVFMEDSTTGDTIRLYEDVGDTSYSIDWYNQQITISSVSDITTNTFSINVYEFGGGNQLARSNSQDNPIRDVDLGANTCAIYLDINFQGAASQGYSLVDSGGNPWYAPMVLVNGNKLTYGENDDYYFTQRPGGLGQIIFNNAWDDTSDYISYVVFGETPVTQNSVTWENGYSIPETETFEYDGSTTTWTLSNYSGDDNETNAIVEINGQRLNSTDWSITTGDLTVTAALSNGDIVACTTFNVTGQQSLVTDTFTGVTVAPIIGIDTNNPAEVTTSINHNLSNGDQIKIQGVEGATGYNNQTFYVQVTSPTTFELYVDSGTTVPVNGATYDTYLTGGYVWRPSDLMLTNSWRQLDTQRLWVTINGYKVLNEKLELSNDYYLGLLTEVQSTDTVIVTSMVTNETPNELSFTLVVDKEEVQTVYRTDLNTKTWLVQNLDSADTTIYVNDASKIVTVTNETYKLDSSLTISIPDVDLNITTSLRVFKDSVEIDPDYYYIDRVQLVPTIVFTAGSGLVVDDIVLVQIAQGNTVIIEGEDIRFAQVDLDNNTLSGLTRGVLGTTVVPLHSEYTLVYGFAPENKMPTPYLGVTWNSNYYNAVEGDPLQLSTTPAALFLKYGSV